MNSNPSLKVAVIGAGVIGRSWALVFARAGFETRIYDAAPGQGAMARSWLEDVLATQQREGAGEADPAGILARVRVCAKLADALESADYVQESGPEKIEEKRAIYAGLDAAAAPETVLASSTSTHDMSVIAEGLAGAHRCIVAHPVNPPHVIPVVEVLPGAATRADIVDFTMHVLGRAGQTPVRLNRYAHGFLLNRMQAALLREAVNLVEDGIADVDAVDAVIRDGLGLRWTLMGPFGVANTNADGGIREYLGRYASAFRSLMDDLDGTPELNPESIERLGLATDAMVHNAAVPDLLQWRDRQIRRIRQLKEGDPHPSGTGTNAG